MFILIFIEIPVHLLTPLLVTVSELFTNVRCGMEGSVLSSDQGCPILRNTGICIGLCRVKGIIS